MCTENQAKTMHFGISADTSTARNANRSNWPFTSVEFTVKYGLKQLFLEVQCCFAGNTALHKGHPKHYTHCIYLKDSIHILPYEWSDSYHCWYLPL